MGIRVAKITRRVLLVIKREGLRLVHIRRSWSDHAWNWIVSSVQRSRVDERFENGSRLSKSICGTIELTPRIVSTADHRYDFSGLSVDSHQRCLKSAGFKSLVFDRVEVSKLLRQGSVSSTLQIHVDCGVDTQVIGSTRSSNHVA